MEMVSYSQDIFDEFLETLFLDSSSNENKSDYIKEAPFLS